MGENKKISRKDFFRVGGSTVAGLSIMGIAGNHLYKMLAKPEELFYGDQSERTVVRRGEALPSPYRKIFAFKVEEPITAFEMAGDRLYAAADKSIRILNREGAEEHRFATADIVRDVVSVGDELYVLHPTMIGVYTLAGATVRSWEACSPESDYCSMAIVGDEVFVTDASNKNICQYNREGAFRRFIDSPNGFIVPSYSFGITTVGDKVYCSNPGRHTVECYDMQGKFVASFGKAGSEAGAFSGCCNPVHLTTTPTGDIITSEKGVPRISCYGRDGKYHATLLDEFALGVGYEAREVRADGNRLIVAGANSVSVFQYEERFAQQTACGDCEVDCPLRKGVTI